jgi:hypothetical protein
MEGRRSSHRPLLRRAFTHRQREERELFARTVPTFDWQDTLDINRTFATYITQMGSALLAQDAPLQFIRLDLLTQEEILLHQD